MASSKLKKARTPAATHPPVSAPVSQPPSSHPQPPPTPRAPPPTPFARFEERMSSVPNAFTPFRIGSSKRHRTMSGASAEAVDGTNAGASTVLTSPANSTRSPTPKLLPPQRDPQQATYVWRNKEEAEAVQRGGARRRRPGVHFEGYEDHPQAERHRFNYAVRARDKVRS
ncbi:hypothetical protein EDB84DRAFT_1258929 [Lactarius hengduanensis]|nr:hypothetical protein EDB84DRAFT_1258929 [Lactarius hengduanensis]